MFATFFKSSEASKLGKAMRTVTQARTIDVDKELLRTIVEACGDAESRQDLMRHLQQCMAEVAAKDWRRICGALHIIEAVLKDGASELVAEMAEGLHFDVVWRLTLLSRFEYVENKRAEFFIRDKAGRLRAEILERQHAIQGDNEKWSSPETCSKDKASATAERSQPHATTGDSAKTARRVAGKENSGNAVMNGLMRVWHGESFVEDAFAEDDWAGANVLGKATDVWADADQGSLKEAPGIQKPVAEPMPANPHPQPEQIAPTLNLLDL